MKTPHSHAGRDSGARDCRARLTQMFEYLDGELSPAQRRVLERHLASCDCCEEMAESLRRVMDTCRAAGGQSLPQDVQRRARLRIKRLLDEMT